MRILLKKTWKENGTQQHQKAYRTIAKQKAQIRRYENKIRAPQRKVQRLQRKSGRTDTGMFIASPATKARRLVGAGDKIKICKELTFNFGLQNDIRTKLSDNAKQHRSNLAMHSAVVGPILRRYRFMRMASEELALRKRTVTRAMHPKDKNILSYTRKKRNSQNSTEDEVIKFFLQDENSTPAAGKKETLTKDKVKVQRRYLMDTLGNLYSKFRKENPRVPVSYVSFTRWRPFFVVPPFVVCDNHNELCMQRKCTVCKDNLQNMYSSGSESLAKRHSTDVISYDEWGNKTDVRKTIKGEITVNQMTKVNKSDTIANVCKVFEEDLQKLMAHEFRIHQQFAAIRSIKNKLAENECVLQIDFSENYATKAHTEIQSMHFGGNRKQISIHTCHATFAKEITKCCATLSEDCRHSAAAVWAHLTHVIKDLVGCGVDTLHVVSDGPTTQYRNKTNFQLMATYAIRKLGIQRSTWSLLEAGHGKGPADGIGAAIKGMTDRLVASGTDILSCRDMLNVLRPRKTVKLFDVSSDDIDKIGKIMENIKPMNAIKGTMSIHQLIVPSYNVLYHRKLSCFCGGSSSTTPCECHQPVQADLPFCSMTAPESHSNKSTSTASATRSLSSTIEQIEASLSATQVALFQRRLREGYDVEIQDLSELQPEEQAENLCWKTWRAAKLNEAAATHSSQSHSSVSTDWDESPSENDEIDGDLWVPREKRNQESIDEGKFYAVFFLQRRNKTVHVGSPVRTSSSNEIEMKFLEKKLRRCDWPKRPDICTIERKCILQELKFDGPLPYLLDAALVKKLNNKAEGSAVIEFDFENFVL